MSIRDRLFLRKMHRARDAADARAAALHHLDRALGGGSTSVAEQRRRLDAVVARVGPRLTGWHDALSAARDTMLQSPGPTRIGVRGRRLVSAVDRAEHAAEVNVAVETYLRACIMHRADAEQNRRALIARIRAPLQRPVRNQEAAARSADACLEGGGWVDAALRDANDPFGSRAVARRPIGTGCIVGLRGLGALCLAL